MLFWGNIYFILSCGLFSLLSLFLLFLLFLLLFGYRQEQWDDGLTTTTNNNILFGVY
jgi:hypothetical protein